MRDFWDLSSHWFEIANRLGRLSRSDPSFGRHVRACAPCRHRVVLNDKTGALLRALTNESVMPEKMHFRRLRARLLRDASTSGRLCGSRRLPYVGAAATAFALAAILLVAKLRPRPAPDRISQVARQSSDVASAAPSAPALASATAAVRFAGSVTPGPEARWLQVREDQVERVSLLGGEIRVRVRKQAPNERFIVEVPDGTVEVRGTTFDVRVLDGKTRKVHVVEGVVQVRVRAQSDATLTAGQDWEPSATASVSSSARAGSSRRSSLPDDGTADYAAAAGLYRDGQFEDAAEAFHHFALAHPSSSTADDADFLEAAALARMGRADAAAVVAARHIERFPRSFHRRDSAILVARAARAHDDCQTARTALAPWLGDPEGGLARELGSCAIP